MKKSISALGVNDQYQGAPVIPKSRDEKKSFGELNVLFSFGLYFAFHECGGSRTA